MGIWIAGGVPIAGTPPVFLSGKNMNAGPALMGDGIVYRFWAMGPINAGWSGRMRDLEIKSCGHLDVWDRSRRPAMVELFTIACQSCGRRFATYQSTRLRAHWKDLADAKD